MQIIICKVIRGHIHIERLTLSNKIESRKPINDFLLTRVMTDECKWFFKIYCDLVNLMPSGSRWKFPNNISQTNFHKQIFAKQIFAKFLHTIYLHILKPVYNQ